MKSNLADLKAFLPASLQDTVDAHYEAGGWADKDKFP